MVMTPDRGGVFDVLSTMARLGLGGPVAGGGQYVSWIHGDDVVRALDFLLEHPELSGPVNLAAPHPLTQAETMRVLRRTWGRPGGCPRAGGWRAPGRWPCGPMPSCC